MKENRELLIKCILNLRWTRMEAAQCECNVAILAMTRALCIGDYCHLSHAAQVQISLGAHLIPNLYKINNTVQKPQFQSSNECSLDLYHNFRILVKLKDL